MKSKYIKPAIEVVASIKTDCLMGDFLSTNIGTGGTPPPSAGSKPDGDWGNTWNVSETDNTWE